MPNCRVVFAAGLAAAGIGTLRYDKRTFAFKAQIDPQTLTVEEETIADAVAALEFARTLPEADAGAQCLSPPSPTGHRRAEQC